VHAASVNTNEMIDAAPPNRKFGATPCWVAALVAGVVAVAVPVVLVGPKNPPGVRGRATWIPRTTLTSSSGAMSRQVPTSR
jgi:hypothetical protein